jgi:hypothetical protein
VLPFGSAGTTLFLIALWFFVNWICGFLGWLMMDLLEDPLNGKAFYLGKPPGGSIPNKIIHKLINKPTIPNFS